jgi:RNA polymerase sigma-70 factor (ECF subfamily)
LKWMSWKNETGVARADVPPAVAAGRSGARDDDPFMAAIVKLRPYLRLRALCWVQDAAAADDLVQEGLERAISNRHTFDPGSNLKAWITSIMRNVFIDGWRKSCHHIGVDDDGLPCDFREPAAPGPIDLLSTEDVRAALARLSARDRTIFSWAYLDRISYREISARLGAPSNTVATRLFRAKKKLRLLLDRIYRERLAAVWAQSFTGHAPP